MKELQAKEESEEAPYLSTRPQLLVRPQFQAELAPDRPQGSAGSMLHGGLDPQWPEWVHGGRLHRACPNCFARALQLVQPNHHCQMSPTRLASVKHDHLIIIAGAKVNATFVIRFSKYFCHTSWCHLYASSREEFLPGKLNELSIVIYTDILEVLLSTLQPRLKNVRTLRK